MIWIQWLNLAADIWNESHEHSPISIVLPGRVAAARRVKPLKEFHALFAPLGDTGRARRWTGDVPLLRKESLNCSFTPTLSKWQVFFLRSCILFFLLRPWRPIPPTRTQEQIPIVRTHAPQFPLAAAAQLNWRRRGMWLLEGGWVLLLSLSLSLIPSSLTSFSLLLSVSSFKKVLNAKSWRRDQKRYKIYKNNNLHSNFLMLTGDRVLKERVRS